MAKIETYERQTIPNQKADIDTLGLRYAAFSARNPDEGIGRSIARLGSSVSGAGLEIADIGLRRKEAQDAITAVKMQAEIETGLNSLFVNLDNEISDGEEFVRQYGEASQTFLEDKKQNVSPGIWKRLEPHILNKMVSMQTKMQSIGIEKTKNQGLALLDIGTDSVIDEGLNALKAGDLSSVDKTIEKYDILLETMKASNIITPEEAVVRKMRFEKQFTTGAYIEAYVATPNEEVINLIQSDQRLNAVEKSSIIDKGNAIISERRRRSLEVEEQKENELIKVVGVEIGAGNEEVIALMYDQEWLARFRPENQRYLLTLLERRINPPVSTETYEDILEEIKTGKYVDIREIIGNKEISNDHQDILLKQLEMANNINTNPTYRYGIEEVKTIMQNAIEIGLYDEYTTRQKLDKIFIEASEIWRAKGDLGDYMNNTINTAKKDAAEARKAYESYLSGKRGKPVNSRDEEQEKPLTKFERLMHEYNASGGNVNDLAERALKMDGVTPSLIGK